MMRPTDQETCHLKESLLLRVSKRRGHTIPCRDTRGSTSDAQDAEEMSDSVAQSLYCVFPPGKARQGRVSSLGLVSFNNFRGLRAIGMAPSGLVLALG